MARVLFGNIYSELKNRIVSGVYPKGTFLPSEQELTSSFGCSRMTVRKATSLLANEGLVQAIKGRGVRVIWDSKISPASEDAFTVSGIQSFSESARAIGATPSAQVVLLDHIECTEDVSWESGLPKGEDLTRVHLLRFLDGHRVASDRHLFPTSEIPGIDEKVATSSLFRYIEQDLGITISIAQRQVTVEAATDRDRDLFGDECPDFFAVMRSYTYSSNGEQIEYVESRYIPKIFHFRDTATRKPMP
ncbi:MAG: UTRA domain-containing protein [Tractidigestivibacter sp.]|jgi:GntR family trehalose operon transcriptional repressor|uniref:UTRA domain-containing protein n=1 Tax=Tractidigestivibacter sp. TaxID=2847320 RepID=UPI003D8DE2F2